MRKISKAQFDNMVRMNTYDEAIKILKKEMKFDETKHKLVFKENRVVLEFLEPQTKLNIVKSTKKQRKIEKQKEKHRAFSAKREKFYNEVQARLKDNVPKSEQWFRGLYHNHFYTATDKYDTRFNNKYLPDIVNTYYKYVIEVDGSIHTLARVQKRDKLKDEYYTRFGYQVIRVIANDILSYVECIRRLCHIRRFEQVPTTSFFTMIKSLGVSF